ncbi:parathyroid hormone 2 receptor [Amblyraja radiata]|uniref:parathyroid hormone 2 receptor n=1 Tax=Amblyraja radiata TaxID=386614 RepID=UPI001403F857|nr:parathyroid hormone 2 receptor [Amblyraja radiata]
MDQEDSSSGGRPAAPGLHTLRSSVTDSIAQGNVGDQLQRAGGKAQRMSDRPVHSEEPGTVDSHLRAAKDGSCSPEWDGLTCWPNGIPGSLTVVPCPSYVYDFNHDGFAYRHCEEDGKWKLAGSLNRTWTNYTECFVQYHNSDRQEFFERLSVMYTIGYAVSLCSLTIAIMIMGYFKRLHCTRNYIHVHLFISFMLRAISIFIKDHVVYSYLGKQYDSSSMDDLKAFTVAPVTDKFSYVGCKIAVVLFLYFFTTNYYWILVEGLYLHCLILMAFLSDRKYLWTFTFIGWGVPSVFTVAWAVVRATLADERCWELNIGNFHWIYQTPIVIAIVEDAFRKLAKSTLILVLVFGVHYAVFIGVPHTYTGLAWEIRMHFELFFNSFQGFFVAIIYCFCTGEVQTEIKKLWTRWTLSLDWNGKTSCGSHRYATALTNLTNSTASHEQVTGHMSLLTCKLRKNGAKQEIAQLTLPGCVRSSSDHDSIQAAIPEEFNGNGKKQEDIIFLREHSKPA